MHTQPSADDHDHLSQDDRSRAEPPGAESPSPPPPLSSASPSQPSSSADQPAPPIRAAGTYLVQFSDGQHFGPIGLDGLAQWAREQRIPTDAMIIDHQGNAIRADSMPQLQKMLATPPTAPVPNVQGLDDQPNAVATVIPYKNPPALMAYYISLLALLPFVGAVFGIVAFTLGIIGLRRRKANPKVKGSVHAWIGIIVGGLLTLAWVTCLGVVVYGNYV